MFEEDTIAAIATPLGEGGLAVIRLSGPASIAMAGKVFRPSRSNLVLEKVASHTVHHGWILKGDQKIDEVMATVFRAPRTFTREDVVEISCHGGILTAKLVLDALLGAGARLAGPGEFTKRAFLSGRIDLVQAEAVADLIRSRTELALEAANEQLSGSLSRRVNELRDSLMVALAHLEAHIDFPDEDIAPDTLEQMVGRLKDADTFMERLLGTAREGEVLRHGIRIAIIGRPNAGKSCLLNLLAGHDRAIVSAIAGTTRDTVEAICNVRGVPMIFVDTAGLRQSADLIEQEGIRRSREISRRAELILHVLDGSEPLTDEDALYLREFEGSKRLIIRNKIDLPQKLDRVPEDGSIDVSCLTGHGLESLKDRLRDKVWSGQAGGEMLQVMINSRHQEALRRAQEGTQRSLQALQEGAELELVAMELRIAVNAVGEIVGKTTTEDLLDSIFSQFCIGK